MADSNYDINTDSKPVSDYVHPHSVNAGTPVEAIKPPSVGNKFEVDEAVLGAFPLPNTTLVTAHSYGSSLWGKIAKLVTKLEDGKKEYYFLKIIPFDNPGEHMCRGEFESLKAMYAVVPKFIPKVYQWGHLKSGPGYFLLAEFREVGEQPPEPSKFTKRVAELHYNSVSPNGKFGFHVPTFHGNLPTYTEWEESWTVMYSKILARAMDIDQHKSNPGPEFIAVRKLFFDKVIPRLLNPLSTGGRSIKPCLVHGDLWDENCATDMATGEPFAFDAGSLYAHNEYEIGYWRPPRHRLSNKAYIRAYKRQFPVSEPADEWDDRNLLYSMRYNIGLNVLIPSSGQRVVVFEDMVTLCRKYFPRELSDIDHFSGGSAPDSMNDGEELEYEEGVANESLENTASAMGLQSTDLLAELHKDSKESQPKLADVVHEPESEAKTGAEAQEGAEMKEPHNVGGKDSAIEIEEAPLEDNTNNIDAKPTQQLPIILKGYDVPGAEASVTSASESRNGREEDQVKETKSAHTDI